MRHPNTQSDLRYKIVMYPILPELLGQRLVDYFHSFPAKQLHRVSHSILTGIALKAFFSYRRAQAICFLLFVYVPPLFLSSIEGHSSYFLLFMYASPSFLSLIEEHVDHFFFYSWARLCHCFLLSQDLSLIKRYIYVFFSRA